MIRTFVSIIVLILVSGCTTETGGSAAKSSEMFSSYGGRSSEDGMESRMVMHPDGTVELTRARKIADTQQPTIERNTSSASTTQPSIVTWGDIIAKITGGDAGELGDFSFKGVQKSAGNIAVAIFALICAAGCYFMPPPKKYFAMALCVGVAILAMLMPWALALIALGIIVLVIGYWSITHGLLSDQHKSQLIQSVKNIMEDNPDRVEAIKDAAARAQVDPKLKAAVKAA